MPESTSRPGVVCATDRLVLRRFILDDAPDFHRLRSDPDVMRFSLHGPETPEEIDRRLRSYIDGYARDPWGSWLVESRQDGTFFGQCGLLLWEEAGRRDIEVAYRLLPRFWGRGYATEAVLATIAYGFEQLTLDRIVAIIEPANVASIRVAEKAGLRYERDITYHGLAAGLYVIPNPA